MSQLLHSTVSKGHEGGELAHDSMIVFWNESKGPTARRGPDVGLDFADQPAPAAAVPPQPPGAGDDLGHPGYDDPHGDMPVGDEDMPPPQGPEPDLDSR